MHMQYKLNLFIKKITNFPKLILLTTLSFNSLATTIDISSSTDKAELSFNTLGDYSYAPVFGGGIYSGNDRSIGFYASLGTPPSNTSSNSPLLFVGEVKAYGIYIRDYDSNTPASLGVSIGGGVGYRFLTSIPTALLLRAQVSPDPLNLYDANIFYNFDVSYEAILLPSVLTYVAYRYAQLDFDEDIKIDDELTDSNYELINNFYIGIKLRF